MFTVILKRDGRAVPYDKNKIEHVVYKAMEACSRGNHEESARIADIVEQRLKITAHIGGTQVAVFGTVCASLEDDTG